MYVYCANYSGNEGYKEKVVKNFNEKIEGKSYFNFKVAVGVTPSGFSINVTSNLEDIESRQVEAKEMIILLLSTI